MALPQTTLPSPATGLRGKSAAVKNNVWKNKGYPRKKEGLLSNKNKIKQNQTKRKEKQGHKQTEDHKHLIDTLSFSLTLGKGRRKQKGLKRGSVKKGYYLSLVKFALTTKNDDFSCLFVIYFHSPGLQSKNKFKV